MRNLHEAMSAVAVLFFYCIIALLWCLLVT